MARHARAGRLIEAAASGPERRLAGLPPTSVTADRPWRHQVAAAPTAPRRAAPPGQGPPAPRVRDSALPGVGAWLTSRHRPGPATSPTRPRASTSGSPPTTATAPATSDWSRDDGAPRARGHQRLAEPAAAAPTHVPQWLRWVCVARSDACARPWRSRVSTSPLSPATTSRAARSPALAAACTPARTARRRAGPRSTCWRRRACAPPARTRRIEPIARRTPVPCRGRLPGRLAFLEEAAGDSGEDGRLPRRTR